MKDEITHVLVMLVLVNVSCVMMVVSEEGEDSQMTFIRYLVASTRAP